MATTVALSEAAARAGTRAANALQEGDEFPGASGAAKIAGFYDDPTLRSIFTTAFSHTWKIRKGVALGPLDGPVLVERIEAPRAV